MKSFLQFVNESLDNDVLIDLYQNFIRILKLHEEHFYHKTLISNNKDFKSELNKVFEKIKNGTAENRELLVLIAEYEQRLYKNHLILGEGYSSVFRICYELTNKNDNYDYIFKFSEKDIFTQTKEEGKDELTKLDKEIEELKKKQDEELKKFELLDEVSEKVFADTDKFREETNEEDPFKIAHFMIDRYLEYKKQYPEIADEIDAEIDDTLNYFKEFDDEDDEDLY
jgi:hypothetical protein